MPKPREGAPDFEVWHPTKPMTAKPKGKVIDLVEGQDYVEKKNKVIDLVEGVDYVEKKDE